MEAPSSRKKIDQLGKRMATEGRIPAADQGLFTAIFDYYEHLLDSVADQLVSIGLDPTTRVKTTGTMIEKLRREHGIQLSRIADFAGARIVCEGGRVEQDQTVEKVCAIGRSHPRKPDVIDRRTKPSHGYRAVHVVLYPNGYPVEVQVRTDLQDTWAQLFERFADQWGRQIRYGGTPSPPAPDELGTHSMRCDVVGILQRLSTRIDDLEASKVRRHFLKSRMEKLLRLAKALDDSSTSDDDLLNSIGHAEYAALRRDLISGLQKFGLGRRQKNRIVRRNLPRRRLSKPGLSRTVHLLYNRTIALIEENEVLYTTREERVRETLQVLSEIPDRKGEDVKISRRL